MRTKESRWAQIHIAAWIVWAGTWLIAVVLAEGDMVIVADSLRGYLVLGVLFISCFALVGAATAAQLRLGKLRATWGPIGAIAAMMGLMLPAAVRQTSSQDSNRGTNSHDSV